MPNPVVNKVKTMIDIAVENGWKGNVSREFHEGTRIIIFYAKRNDETIKITWHGTRFKGGNYGFFDKVTMIPSSGQALKKIQGWPDIISLFKSVPIGARPALAAKYVKLPFDLASDDDETIIEAMIDRKVFWYNRIDSKIEVDVMMRSKKNRIQPVGHRKLLHFISPVVGFRSVLLDQVLRVG